MAATTIRLEQVAVRYRVPQERVHTFKEFTIRWLRRRLAYHDFWALRGVDLEVRAGEVFGVIGANGAGKSTLLKVVARVLRPTAGRVRVWGRVAPLLELGAGFDLELSGRENIVLNGAILGRSRAEMLASMERIVAFAELEGFIDAPLRTYSSGMQARLGFAVATDVTPELLLVDEVLAVGDAAFAKKCEGRFAAFRAAGTTILIVSHNLAMIKKMCDRVGWLRHGEVAEVGDPGHVVDAFTATVS